MLKLIVMQFGSVMCDTVHILLVYAPSCTYNMHVHVYTCTRSFHAINETRKYLAVQSKRANETIVYVLIKCTCNGHGRYTKYRQKTETIMCNRTYTKNGWQGTENRATERER